MKLHRLRHREGAVEEPAAAPLQRPISAQGVGALLSFLDTPAIESRRYFVVRRLRQLRDSDEFASLPEDLQVRVREIVGSAER